MLPGPIVKNLTVRIPRSIIENSALTETELISESEASVKRTAIRELSDVLEFNCEYSLAIFKSVVSNNEFVQIDFQYEIYEVVPRDGSDENVYLVRE